MFAVLFSLFTFGVHAQPLSGTVTIDAANATGGTNYQTFNAFAAAVNTAGVAAPGLVVDVVPNSGPYIEQVTFTQITGASAANKIVINGNGNLLQFTATISTQPWTILLSGTDYMTINDLNVEGLSPSWALVCILTGNANYNSFNRCSFKTPANTTTSLHTPFAISGSNTSPTSTGASGNFNAITSCTMMNGYYGISLYSSTSAPYQEGNRFDRCLVEDFYYSGFYSYYAKGNQLTRSKLHRPTRTASPTIYGVYVIVNHGAKISGNLVESFYANHLNASSTCYPIYAYQSPTANMDQNEVSNNIIRDMKTNGTIQGIYSYYNYRIFNNTVDLDWAGATSANTIYGIYTYGTAGYPVSCENNLITCRRGGAGNARYGIYFGIGSSVSPMNNNNIHMKAASGLNYIGNNAGVAVLHTSLTAWRALGYDLNGDTLDPIYSSSTSVMPTNPLLNNRAVPKGLVFDQAQNIRNQSTPDIGALEFLEPACTGTPGGISVLAPTTAVCPNEIVDLTITPLTTTTGIQYGWQYSTISNVGPWTQVPNSGSVEFQTLPVTGNIWYSVVSTCTNVGGGALTSVAHLTLSGTTTNTVRYFDGFEKIGKNDRLPNCSWAASNLGASCKTYTTSLTGNRTPMNGTSYGNFSAPTAIAGDYFYTNGIYLSPGVTYSASSWYVTDGQNGWSEYAMFIGPNQSTTGLVPVATTGLSNHTNAFYKPLSSTFTVSTPGLYHLAIKARNINSTGGFLSFDDVEITAPCTLNSPTVVLSPAGSIQGCIGQGVLISAAGANTYTWNGTSFGNSLSYIVTGNGNINLAATNTLAGCTSNIVIPVLASQSPIMGILAPNPSVCKGSSVILTAYGANNYNWTTGATTSTISVSPTVTTSYTVTGVNTSGCNASISQQITVTEAANILAFSSAENICAGDIVTLSGVNASTYTWSANNAYLIGASVNVQPPVTTTYTLEGTDAANCKGLAKVVTVNVSACVGINEANASLSGTKLYPNPNNGEFTLEFASESEKSIEVIDLTGRLVVATKANGTKAEINIKDLSAGVYYVKIKSDNASTVVKFVKQ